MPGRIFPFADGVCAIRVRKHGERFIVLDQLIDEEFARLVMTIVVACTVDQECKAACNVPQGATSGKCELRCELFPAIRRGTAPMTSTAAPVRK